MRLSNYFLPTLKETPADAEMESHKLMLKAGLIRKVTAGVYDYLPLGFKVLKRIEEVVREEMNRAGAQEIKLPIIQPATLWKESGRWDDFGPEMFKLADRKDREFALGPTHEEIITDMVRNELNSYKDLPLVLFQINDKYRDEIRPRHGVMRSREFLMKDAYSFHATQESLDETYERMYDAYARVFDRLGLDWVAVEAPTGLMGGSYSQEFMALADEGGEEIVVCEGCNYSSNIEIAKYEVSSNEDENSPAKLKEVETPGLETVEEVANHLGVPSQKVVKTFFYRTDDGLVAALVGGDDDIEEMKLINHLGAKRTEMISSQAEIKEITGANFGSIGPVGLEDDIPVYADIDIKSLTNFTVGANKNGYHLTNVNWGRDIENVNFINLRKVREGDSCPECGSELDFHKSIEVGQIFQLGTKYSDSLDGEYQDQDGNLNPYIMGCYGIGISRLIPAVIQQNYDSRGINWTSAVTPFSAELIVLGSEDEKSFHLGQELYRELKGRDYEVLLDDRETSPGFKFNDADLIGVPVKIIIGPRGLEKGVLEVEFRSGNKEEIEVENREIEQIAEKLGDMI
ncbi:MAG: proline--tRNA ligase [Candidatus Bipolaricaulota bacterium]|nr:proline--tRNA ligase [Candidatus Bipolaricaulota bacterium]